MKKLKLTKEEIGILHRSFYYLSPYKFRTILLFSCVVLSSIIGIAYPLVWGKLIVSLTTKNEIQFNTNIFLVVILYIIEVITNYVYSIIIVYTSNDITNTVKLEMFDNILKLPMAAFDNTRTGGFTSKLNQDAGVIAQILTSDLMRSINNLIRVVIIGIAIAKINLILFVVIVVLYPITLLIYKIYGKILREKNLNLLNLNDKYFSFLQDTFRGIREVKSLGISSYFSKKGKGMFYELKKQNIGISKTSLKCDLIIDIMNFIINFCILFIGFKLVKKDILTVSYYIAFSAYSNQFLTSLKSLSEMNITIEKALVSLNRIYDIIDNLKYKNNYKGYMIPTTTMSSINIDNVSFGYNNMRKILKDIKLDIEPYSKTAIVGKSGSGKTTLFNLLLRLYKPDYGKILFDKIDINDLDETFLRDNICVIRQEPILFNTTIKENLLLANNNVSMDEIENACKQAFIHDYILTLPDKYETIVNEQSSNFSIGQKQRIAIARGLLKKSPIILMDEVTSSLDNESQYYINKAIDSLRDTHTIIIIAHRLSTIINSDLIAFIEDGRIICSGDHKYLINNNVRYKSFFENELLDIG